MQASTSEGESRNFRRSVMAEVSPTPRLACLSARKRSEARQDLVAVEAHEACLVGADLVRVDVVEAGVRVLADRLEVPRRIGPARHELGDLILGDRSRRRFE